MSDSKTILAIDTALKGCNVAVLHKGKTCTEFIDTDFGQAEHLVPTIQDCIDKAGAEFSDLDVILTTLGPGTFTGLRIGLSTAKALALALSTPIFGISTLQAMALQSEGECLIILESKREELYTQIFDSAQRSAHEPELLKEHELPSSPHKILTNAHDRLEGYADRVEEHIRALDLKCVIDAFQKEPSLFSENCNPIYLRDADISQPKNPPRKLKSI